MATTETETAPVAPPQGGADPLPETPPAATPPSETPPVEATTTEAPKKPPTPRDYRAERLQERIDRLTAQSKGFEEEIAKLRAGQTQDATKIQQEIDTLAEQKAQVKAQQIAAWNTFTGQLNTAIAEGQKEFGEEKYNASVEALRTLHDPRDAEGHTKYLSMLQAVLDTGAAAKLIQQLGEDPNEAARIMGLSPTKMGVELGKLASNEVEKVSDAPKPLSPLGGVGRNHVAIAAEDTERSDKLDSRVWFERRQAHVNELNKKAGRRVIP